MKSIGRHGVVALAVLVGHALVLAGGCKRSTVDVPLSDICSELQTMGDVTCSLPRATWKTLKSMHNGVTRFTRETKPGEHYNFRPIQEDRQKVWTGPFLAQLGDLGKGRDKVVADIGTGGGYLAFRLARLSAKVFAQDTRAEALTYTTAWAEVIRAMASHPDERVKARVADLSTHGITFVKGTEHKTGLPAAGLDVAYMASVYHCVASTEPGEVDTVAMRWLRDIGRAIRPGGRLVIIENLVNNKLNEQDLVKNCSAAGFRLLRKVSPECPTCTLAFVFQKPKEGERPSPPRDEPPPTFDRHRDLVYKEVGPRKLRLDLYLPRGVARPLATVVYLHGGGWHSGNKAPCPVQPLVSDGFAVACPEYRLSAEAIFPAQLHDVRAAVSWLRKDGARYGLATEKIGAWGLSAGGHLATMLGTATGVAALQQEDPAEDPARHRVNAVVAWYPPTDLQAMKWDGYQEYAVAARQLLGLKQVDEIRGAPLARLASPVNHASRDDPPHLLMHGHLDRVVPIEQSRLLHKALNTAGANAALRELPRAGHGNGFEQAQEKEVRDFFRQHLRGDPGVPVPHDPNAEPNKPKVERPGPGEPMPHDPKAEPNKPKVERPGPGEPAWAPPVHIEDPFPPTLKAHKDLIYRKVKGQVLRLDLYHPTKASGPMVPVVFLHGGGWYSGSKVPCPTATLAKDGFAVVCADYRLSGVAPFPAQLHDVRAVVRWIRENGNKYKLATEKIGVWGLSAGGHLASLLGTAAGVPELVETAGQDNRNHRVQAVAAWFPPTDFASVDYAQYDDYRKAAVRLFQLPNIESLRAIPKLVRLASPVALASRDDAPHLIMHGQKDRSVPPEQGRALARALTRAGAVAKFQEVLGAGHGDGFDAAQEVMVRDFFREHLRGGR